MNNYIVNTVLGLMLVQGEDHLDAWMNFATVEQEPGNVFLDREDLIKKGFVSMEPTDFKEVFRLITKSEMEVAHI